MPTPESDRTVGDPVPNPGDEPYFEAAARGRLLIRSCRACGAVHHYPRSLCPFCWSGDLDWVEASGRGEIYTCSVTRRGAGAPYCIAYVALEEGPVMMTNIVGTDLDAVRIGQRVEVAFRHSANGTAVPVFTPVPPSGEAGG